nr:MAG TPA: tail collar fiber protein [Caudoviricetes sp.]
MANWNGLVMTDKGIALQSKVQAGEVLNITKLKLGSGTLPEETDIRKLTDLIKPEQNLGIGGREPNGDYCKISATISNVGLEAGYYVRELGVFAQDPDDGEILYAYTTDGAPDYLPAEGGSTVISQEFSVNIAVSDTDKINVEIDPGALATMGYVQLQINEHNEDAAAHEQAFSQHNTDETAHYDMTGATGSKAGKRGFVPAPKAGDQNKVLFGNGQFQDIPLPEIASQEESEAGTDNEKMMTPLRSKQLRDKLTVNNIQVKNNNIDLNCKFFTALAQVGFEYATITPELLAENLPANSTLTFYATSASGSDNYAPKLGIIGSYLIIVRKGVSATVPVSFEAIAMDSRTKKLIGNYTNASSYGFSGWSESSSIKKQVLGKNGYTLYDNGYIEQWGYAFGAKTVTFPLAMSEVYVCLPVDTGSETTAINQVNIDAGSLTGTGFSFHQESSVSVSQYGIYWVAKGKV